MIFILILGFILGAAVVVFVSQNTDVVALSFLQYQFDASLAVVVLLSLLVGVLLTLIAVLPGTIGNAFSMRRLQKHNDKLARENEQRRIEMAETQARAETLARPRPDVIDLSQ